MIIINKEFLKMSKLLQIFKEHQNDLLKNNSHKQDFEVSHNNRFIKKEIIDMGDIVERIAIKNIELVEKNKELEQKVLNQGKVINSLSSEINI